MEAVRNIAVLARKDLRLLFRDRFALIFVFLVPIGFGLFFGLISQSFSSGDAAMEIGLVDEDQSVWSKHLVDGLGKTEADVTVVSFKDRTAGAEACRRGKIGHVIVIPKGFGDHAGLFWETPPRIELIADPGRAAQTGMLHGLVMQAMGYLAQQRMQDAKSVRKSLDEFTESLQEESDLPLPARLALKAAMTSFSRFMEQIDELEETSEASGESTASGAPDFRLVDLDVTAVNRIVKGRDGAPLHNIQSAWDMSIPQATLWGLLGCSAFFAISIVRERRCGTLLRLQASPLSRRDIIFGKSVACFLSLLLVMSVMLLLGYFLGMRPRRPMLLFVGVPAIAYCFVGVMSVMSLIGKSEESVSGAAWGANIAMAMFGGGMIPLAFLPGMMQKLSYVDPARWAVLLLEGAIWRDFSPLEALPSIAALVVTGTLATSLAALIMQRRSAVD